MRITVFGGTGFIGRRLVAGMLGGLLERLPKAPVNRDFVALMQSDKVAEPGLPTLLDLGITPQLYESWLAEVWSPDRED
jgi:nucleoside-diphosphate-sugar epimerase